MKTLILIFISIVTWAQTYSYQGWAQNCTESGAVTGYRDKCTPANNFPTGTFYPQGVGPANTWMDPLGTPSYIVKDTPHGTAYAPRTAFNVDESYVAFFAGTTEVYNVKTGTLVRTVPGADSGLNRIVWSGMNRQRLYLLSATTAAIYYYDVDAGGASWTQLIAFDGTGGKPLLTSIDNGGTGDTSGDDWIAVDAATQKIVCAVRLTDVAWKCFDYTAYSETMGGTNDYPIVSKGVDSGTGKRYLFLTAYNSGKPSMLLSFTDDTDLSVEGLIEAPQSAVGDRDGVWETGETGWDANHGDTGFTDDGRQFFITGCDIGSSRYLCASFFGFGGAMTSSTNMVYLRRLAATSVTTRNWPSSHTGCAKHVAKCLVSYYGNWFKGGDPALGTNYGARPLDDLTSPYQPYASNWLTEVVENAGTNARYRFVAMNRNYYWAGWTSNSNYYASQRASISPYGRWIAYDTYFGRLDGESNRRAVVAHIAADPDKALRVTNRTTTTATLRYLAPSVSACTITLSTNSDYSSPILNGVSHNPGTNERAYSLTSLTTGTTYYVRVNCGVNADTSFQTR